MTLSQLNLEIQQSIIASCATFGLQLQLSDVHLEKTSNPRFGDISSNVALKFYNKAVDEQGRPFSSPRKFGESLFEQLLLTKVIKPDNLAGPGFINYLIPNEVPFLNLQKIAQKMEVALDQTLANTKITFEYTDPNPFKEFHIGHLYSNTVGESISRILEAQGARVRRVCYQGDVGMHVAKSIWGIKKLAQEVSSIQKNHHSTLSQKAAFLGQAYALGAAAYDDDDEAKEEIQHLNKMIFQKHPDVVELYELGKSWSLEYFETIYQRLGTQFDGYYFESKVAKLGESLVRDYLKKGIFKESNSAIIFPGSQFGLHDRVFINSMGLPTYEAKELGLAPTKYQDQPYDLSIILTGNEIDEYFRVLLKVLSLIDPDLASKTIHLSHGMVRLPDGKMSSRKGNVMTGESLLDEAKRQLRQVLEKNRSDWQNALKESVAEVLAIGAVKYALLKSHVGSDVTFKIEESISFEGNSGPYLQYTYARCKSVLNRATLSDQPRTAFSMNFNPDTQERNLLIQMLYFDEVVGNAAREYAPHYIATYLYDFASAYNAFYTDHQIINSPDETREFRVALTQASAVIIQKGLFLLGIQTVEQM